MRKEELKKYLKMQTELNRLEEKIKEMRYKAESAKNSVISDMPSGGGKKDFTDYLNDLILLQENYDKRAKAIIKEQIRIEQAISSLDIPVERAVLGYRYIDGLSWEQICVKINYSWRQVHYIHSYGLKHLESLHTIAH